jgi:hypothetical protein
LGYGKVKLPSDARQGPLRRSEAGILKPTGVRMGPARTA